MKMETQMREVNGVTVLDLAGRITLGAGSQQLRDAIYHVLGRSETRISIAHLPDRSWIRPNLCANDGL